MVGEIGALRAEVHAEFAALSERVARIETILIDRLPPPGDRNGPRRPFAVRAGLPYTGQFPEVPPWPGLF